MLLQSLKACFAVIISVLCITTSVFAQSALPTAPSSLTVTSTGLPVSLSWTGYDDAVYFNIKRAITSGGPYTTIDTVNAGLLLGVTNTAPINKLNHVFCSYSYKKQVMLLKQQHFTLNVANPLPNFLTQYTDVKAAPGAIYYYVVTATNFQGESSASNEVSVSIPAPRYFVTDIGTFGGETQPRSMNAKSQVVGYSRYPNDAGHAFVWDALHGMQDLGLIDSHSWDSSGVAVSINDSGQIVGSAAAAAFSGATEGGFIWDHEHGMRALATIPESSSRPNGREAVPLIINNDGLILGETYVEEIARDAVHPQAILWDKNLVVINPTKQIPSNWAGPDVVFQAGESINDAGEVAGVINTLVPPSGIGVTYKDGIFTSFDLQDWTARIKLKSENAGGPNKKGEVVGQALNEPVIWENGEWQNNPSSGDTNYHPFSNGTSLNTLIPYGSGIHLDYAFCINDNGDILCRGTANGNSLEHGYLLSSPVHLDITADTINKDDPLSSAFSPLDTGVVYGGSEASTADDLRMTAALTPAINASYTWSVSGLSRTSSGQQWDFGAVLPKPGVLTFTCKAVTTDGHVYTATKDVEVGIRTDDIIVVGWINGDTVTLPSSGVSGWLKKILPSAGPPVPSYVDAYWLLYQLSSGYTDISAPVNHNLSKWTDRIYILNWLFKYAANLPPSDNLNFGNFRDSSDNYIDYRSVAEFVAQPTNYKLFNHLQIKYRVGVNGFNGAPTVLRQETGIGTTHNPFPSIAGVVPDLVPGQEGFYDMHKAVKLLDRVELINDGSPDAHAIGAFDTLLGRNLPTGHSPLLWEDIGSKIRFDWNGGTKPILTPLMFANFPTYWVYDNGKLLDVEPQAANPSDHFTANPYPFGIEALFTPAGASYFSIVGHANVNPPAGADTPPYTLLP